MSSAVVPQPLRKGWRTLRAEGALGVARRVVRVAHQRLDVAALDESLLPGDIADSRRLNLPLPSSPPLPGDRLTIGWVTTPPALGSGGHTTMFRMVEALEQAGHRCILFLYDRYGGDTAAQAAVIRLGWPTVQAEVRSSTEGMRGLDACVATSWPTAHVLAEHGIEPMQRFYFIQDFEPFFYPRGSEYALAEDSYRMGFHCIALGSMVGDVMKSIDVVPDVVEFGCDTEVYYQVEPVTARSGVVFYTRPGVGRRGYQLGCLALDAFHRRHPEQEIHVYGSPPNNLTFPVTRHARMSPAELNQLYNRVHAGLAMSFTNISLVAEEMLAAGCIPVVNDSPYARADLANPYAVWADPTPSALADALSSVVEDTAPAERAARAAKAVVGRSWEATQQQVVRIVEDTVYGR